LLNFPVIPNALVQLEGTYHPPLFNPPMDVDGYCASIKKNQGWLMPWRAD
jgi:hypothetical protein